MVSLTVVRVSLQTWACYTALRPLADEMPQRWRHVQAVARRAKDVAVILAPEDRDLLVAAAWLHDIGYSEELIDTGFHPLDGARHLRRQGAPARLCGLVAHHSAAAVTADVLGLSSQLVDFADEDTTVRDALWYCDAVVGPDGRPVTVEQRIAEIRTRRGIDHPAVRAIDRAAPVRRAAVHRVEQQLRAHANGCFA